MSPPEEWRRIPGSESYEVSSMGNVRHGSRMLKPCRQSNGYLKVFLGSRRQGNVHAFVALAFLGDRPRGMCVAHKNGDKCDNRLVNLQYTTYSGNRLHDRRTMVGRARCPLLAVDGSAKVYASLTTKAKGETHGMSTRSEAMARSVHSMIAEGMLRNEIAAKLGVPYMWVANVAAGRRWAHIHPEART